MLHIYYNRRSVQCTTDVKKYTFSVHTYRILINQCLTFDSTLIFFILHFQVHTLQYFIIIGISTYLPYIILITSLNCNIWSQRIRYIYVTYLPTYNHTSRQLL